MQDQSSSSSRLVIRVAGLQVLAEPYLAPFAERGLPVTEPWSLPPVVAGYKNIVALMEGRDIIIRRLDEPDTPAILRTTARLHWLNAERKLRKFSFPVSVARLEGLTLYALALSFPPTRVLVVDRPLKLRTWPSLMALIEEGSRLAEVATGKGVMLSLTKVLRHLVRATVFRPPV